MDTELQQIMSTFAPRMRRIMQLRCCEGRSYLQIAQAMDMSQWDVKLTYAAALLELSRRLKV